MKKALISFITMLFFVSSMAQGIIVPIDGTHYISGENILVNPSFEESPDDHNHAIAGWTIGDAYKPMYTTEGGGNFLWFAEGGRDGGAYIQANRHSGAAGDGSVGQCWSIQPGKKYYFSFWLAKNKNTLNNQYTVLSLTNKTSEKGGENEEINLLGGSDAPFGVANHNNGEWCQTIVTFDSEDYTYLQFNARWLKGEDTGVCFDDFYLAELTPVGAGTYVFHINNPGTLADSIPDTEKENVTTLVLSGTINGDDITYMKSLPNLRDLDIEKAVIKYESGEIRTEESELMQFDFTVTPEVLSKVAYSKLVPSVRCSSDAPLFASVEEVSGNVVDADSIEIGLKKSEVKGQWMGIDNVVLTYYGNSLDSYKMYIANITTPVEDYEKEGVYVQKELVDAYKAALAKSQSATTKEEILACAPAVYEANDNVRANVNAYAAYAAYVAAVEDADKYFAEHADLAGEDVELMTWYLTSEDGPDETYPNGGAKYILENCLLSTEAIVAETEFLKTLRASATNNGMINGTDCTAMIINPAFDEGNANGWDYSSFTQGIRGYQSTTYTNPESGATCSRFIEAWRSVNTPLEDAEIVQTLAYLPAGGYTLEVDAIACNQGDTNIDVQGVFLFAQEGDNAAAAYLESLHSNDGVPEHFILSFTKLEANSKLTIGVRTKETTANWIAADNFKLIYYGSEEPGTEEPKFANGIYYLKNVESGLYLTSSNSWGTQASLGTHGLDLVITQLVNGKYTIDTDIENGNMHYLGSNGYVDSELTVWTFVEVEQGVYNITFDGVNYLGYDGGATTEVALNLIDPTSAAAQWTLVTKEDLLAEMAFATEENPADATFLITGQGFNRNDTNRNNAWEGTPVLGGDNTNFCAEKFNTLFDVHQTLTNIPNGIYEVSVQGFYRNGGFTEAAVAHNAGTEVLNAVLYANNESAPLMSIFADSKEEAESGWGIETEAGYIPNNMKDASNVFTVGAYANNKVQVIVTDGTLTIGVKKNAEKAHDWAIFDNFELTYYGEEIPNIEIPKQQGSTVRALQNFVLTVGGDKVITKDSKANDTSVRLINKANNNVVASGKTVIVDNNTVEIVLDRKISTAGTYRLEVAAGELCYTYDNRTSFSPDNLFSGMHSLEQVSFFENISNIGTGIFHNCPNLLVVKWNTSSAVETRYFDTPEEMGNLIVYAPVGTNSTYAGNVVIGKQASSIMLTDKKPFRCPTGFKTKLITYSRNFGKTTTPGVAGGWETIVLPFDVKNIVSEDNRTLAPFNNGASGNHPFWLAELTGEGFSYAAQMKANHPYIIAMPNSREYKEEFNIRGNVIFSATDETNGIAVEPTSMGQTSKGLKFELVPAYETVAQGNTIYAINDETYNGMNPGAVFVRNSREVSPFEAYARSLSSVVSSPLCYSIGGDMGEVNGVECLYHETFDGMDVYCQNGVLYVNSPRKQTIGLYSADGRLVRLMNLSEGMNMEYGVETGIYFIGKRKVIVK